MFKWEILYSRAHVEYGGPGCADEGNRCGGSDLVHDAEEDPGDAGEVSEGGGEGDPGTASNPDLRR